MYEQDEDYEDIDNFPQLEHPVDVNGCSICRVEGLENMVEPVETSCGHTFCWYLCKFTFIVGFRPNCSAGPVCTDMLLPAKIWCAPTAGT